MKRSLGESLDRLATYILANVLTWVGVTGIVWTAGMDLQFAIGVGMFAVVLAHGLLFWAEILAR